MRGDLNQMGIARVLIVKGKHETSYFDATGDLLGLIALRLVGERLEEGWYGADEKEPSKPDGLTDKQLNDLGVPQADPSRSAAKAREMRFQVQVQKWERSRHDLDFLRRVIASKNGLYAWNYLTMRSREGHEYEGLELVTLSEIPAPESGQ
jgi:hypothetical protein